jgi:D-lactate dehydrogenase
MQLHIGIKSKDYSRSKLMQMGDYRLDHLVGLTCMEKKSRIIGTGKIGGALQKNHAWFWLQILACDQRKMELIQQIDITYTTLEVCKTQM